MRGDKKVIECLNRVLGNELVAINQYFLHSRMYRDWGLERLAELEYEESIDEMKHADQLIERILFLEGLPNLQDYGKLLIGETVDEIIECDLKIEQKACADLREGYETAVAARDYASKELFEEILISEEEHMDWLETQLDLIKRIGLERYTQSQMLKKDG